MDANFVLGVAQQIAVQQVRQDAANMFGPRVELHIKRLVQVRFAAFVTGFEAAS